MIEEKKAEAAERQAVIRDAVSTATLSMVADKADSTDDKKRKFYNAAKDADARLNESRAKTVEANTRADELKAKNERKAAKSEARVEESKPNKAFMPKIVEM